MWQFSTLTKRGLPFISLLSILCFWEAMLRVGGLNPIIFPPPSRIIWTLIKLLTPSSEGIPVLILHLYTSLVRLVVAVALATAAGAVAGIAAGMNRYAYRVIYPIVNALFPIPPYAWVPFLLLWLGRGSITIVFVTAVSASLPLVYNTMAGVRGVDHRQVWALQTFGGNYLNVVRYVVLPSALTSIILGFRLSLGQAWRTLVGAEFLAAPAAGIGFLIFNARQFLAVDTMFAGIFILGFFGYLLIYWMVDSIEKRSVVRWGIVARR